MPTDSSRDIKSAKETRNYLTQVSDAEKQLWASIQSKGVLSADVKDLYSKACTVYEKLFLSQNELTELQTIEYLLWRLHYKHIDEFRRKITDKSSSNEVDNSNYLDGFRLFLSGATKFYQDLIRKVKSYYGLVDEPWFYKSGGLSGTVEEETKLRRCEFVCHRLCICLGDLARYLELYQKRDDQRPNWSVAAYCYLESAKIYPNGGNPHNQLAVLATYIDDEFLALYHCIRSLAVKEPFPDALQNLMLLFERNRSSTISSLSNKAYDFSKPSEWISSLSEPTTHGSYSNKPASKTAEQDQKLATDLWSLVIRMTSFFFLDSSLDSFGCMFMSMLRELESLLSLDVVKLSSSLESYNKMNLSKAGPYRALHLISVLIFIIHNLTESPQLRIPKPTNEEHRSTLVNLALTVTFICMGRFVDRCLKGSPVIYFPLLPALLVFTEWLADALHRLDVNDEKCESSMRYFFRSFVSLLNYLKENSGDDPYPDHVALWEDYELRGFTLLSHTHVLLDFSSHWESEINYKMKSDHRAHRIIQTAEKIAGKSSKWLQYDDGGRVFRTINCRASSSAVEEEEDIVFKPIVRHNSEPIPAQDKPSPSDECLRRTSSSVPAGPPSLSSWVLNGERSPRDRTKKKEITLDTIEEIVPEELLGGITLSKDETFMTDSTYAAPVPSAPLLPDNAVWYSHYLPASEVGISTQPSVIPQTSLNVPYLNSQTSLNVPYLNSHSPPNTTPVGYYFHNLSGAYGSSDPPGFDLLDGYGHFLTSSPPTIWFEGGPPPRPPSPLLLHGTYSQQARVSPYVAPVTVAKPDPRPLLQQLKQREFRYQQESRFAGYPYMQ